TRCDISLSRPNPRTRNNFAPYACICHNLPSGAVSTIAISHSIPAAAQYAANAAPVLPLEVATQRVLPSARICEIAIAAKRSLYEPVGLQFSNLKYNSMPLSDPVLFDFTNGVLPSLKVI